MCLTEDLLHAAAFELEDGGGIPVAQHLECLRIVVVDRIDVEIGFLLLIRSTVCLINVRVFAEEIHFHQAAFLYLVHRILGSLVPCLGIAIQGT